MKVRYQMVSKIGNSVFGLTKEDYESMRVSQDCRCAVCMKHEGDLDGPFDIVQLPYTGEFKGLLCDKCSKILSDFKYRKGFFIRFVKFLEGN